MIESRIIEGMTNWPQLADAAGLPTEGWTPELLNSRRDAEANRVVLRLVRPDQSTVILKQGFGKGGLKSVGNSVPPQRRAERMLRGSARLGVPEVLAALPDNGALLMQDAGGERLADLVDQDGLLDAVERAGAWLDAFHRAATVEERAFQPRFMLDHLSRVSAEASSGIRSIPRHEEFAKALGRLKKLAEQSQDAPTVSSLRHGDLNARNILVDKTKVWGLDFSEAGNGPVGYDIARLLMHLVELSARPPVADLVPAQLRRAFFEGYRLIKRRDRSLPFLFQARLMSDWASLNAKEDDLSLFKALRLERIVLVAKTALADD